MPSTAHIVTRRPSAPARRAGRVWPVGATRADDLTPADLAALRADPGYAIEPAADTKPAQTPAPKTSTRARKRTA